MNDLLSTTDNSPLMALLQEYMEREYSKVGGDALSFDLALLLSSSAEDRFSRILRNRMAQLRGGFTQLCSEVIVPVLEVSIYFLSR